MGTQLDQCHLHLTPCQDAFPFNVTCVVPSQKAMNVSFPPWGPGLSSEGEVPT